MAVFLRLTSRLSLVCLAVFQAQFQLFNLEIELLGLAAKLHAFQFGDQELELLNFGSMRGNNGIALCKQDVTLGQQGFPLTDHGLQGFDIVRKIGVRWHAGKFTQVRGCLQAGLGALCTFRTAPVNAFEQHGQLRW
jgi:hypothetical protein